MEKYKLRDFAKWAKRERVADSELQKSLQEMNAGLLGDKLGANLYKKRLAINGKGKRGGARIILIFKQGDLA